MWRCSFNTGRDALETDRKVIELNSHPQSIVEKLTQPVIGLEIGAMASQRTELAQNRTKHPPIGETSPDFDHFFHSGE